jgi:hypothetical protein
LQGERFLTDAGTPTLTPTQPPRSADVAEEERVLEVDDLPDRFAVGLSDAVDDATYVVDLEGDVPEPRTVRGRRRLLSAGRR